MAYVGMTSSSAIKLWACDWRSKCGGQRQHPWVSSATLWDMGMELVSSGLYVSTFTHWQSYFTYWEVRLRKARVARQHSQSSLCTLLREAPRAIRKTRKSTKLHSIPSKPGIRYCGRKVMPLTMGQLSTEEQELSKLNRLFYYTYTSWVL